MSIQYLALTHYDHVIGPAERDERDRRLDLIDSILGDSTVRA